MMPHAASVAIFTALAAIACAQSPAPHDERVWLRNTQQVTNASMGLDRAGEAYFSADGERICFQAYPKGQSEYQIYVMNVDGTGLKMVSTGRGATTCSFFHPSGDRLIFAANHHDLRPAVDIDEQAFAPLRAQGAAQTRPASGSRSYSWSYFPGMDVYEYTFATGELRRLTDTDGYDAECAYSPDGKQIVFSSTRTGAQEIFVMSADGSNVRQVTAAGGKNGGPFFSPDGRRIVYRSDRRGTGDLQIFVNDAQGGAEKPITDHDALHWCPFWHPSGKWLIYTYADHSRGRPNYDLFLLSDDGRRSERVTSDEAFDGLPVFSPDGRRLMWTSKRGGLEGAQIFIADFVGLGGDGGKKAPPPN